MDMRLEFNNMINSNGHYILIVHSNKKMRCSCYNDTTHESSHTCPICFGVGYALVTERVLCREKNLTMAESLPKALKTYEYGDNTVAGRAFYLKYNTNIEPKDLIISCSFDRRNLPLLSDYSIYEVSYVERYRGEGGKIEYIKAACDLDTINVKIIASNIRKTGNRDIYNLGIRRDSDE